jgi:hypothetical protein
LGVYYSVEANIHPNLFKGAIMGNKEKGLVGFTLPQRTYKVMSDYSKSFGLSVRRMADMLITEAVSRDLYLDMLSMGAIKRRLNDEKKIDHDIELFINEGVSRETDHCYSGMVVDFHRQYLEDITPVTSSGETGAHVLEQHDVDIDDLLTDTDLLDV